MISKYLLLSIIEIILDYLKLKKLIAPHGLGGLNRDVLPIFLIEIEQHLLRFRRYK